MLSYRALTGMNSEAVRNTGKKRKQKDGKRQGRKEKAGRLQRMPHTPGGHRRCTTMAAVMSSRLVPVPEALLLWLHYFSQLHHGRSSPAPLVAATFVFHWSGSWLHFIASDSVACCPLTVQMSQGCQDLQNPKETPLLIFPPY